MNKTIIITGAGGFIGECLVNHFLSSGWKIKAFVHRLPTNGLANVEYIMYNMMQTPNENVFQDVDALIHCAYVKFEKNKNADEINLTGTKTLIDLCRKWHIKMIFLSSLSAHENAKSHYGISKLQCEKLFDLQQEVVLKTGLVIGNKGLFGEMLYRMNHSSFFPLLDGGKQLVQSIFIEDLYSIMDIILLQNLSGEYYIAEPIPITLKEFYAELANQLHKKITFISIPLQWMYLVCKILEKFKLPFPVTTENLLGLKQLTAFETKEDLLKLGIHIRSYKESFQTLLK